MKLKLLSLLITILVLPLRVASPVRNFIRRVFWLTWARGQLGNVPASTQLDGPVRIHGNRRIRFGDHCRIGSNVELQTEEKGTITLGREVRLNRGTTICSYCEVTIGDYSLVGEFVSIRDANHGIEPDALIRRQPHTSEPIHIGRDVWVGRGACLLPGIEIGDGAVIGANSVVTRSIPAGAIAVGTPAKVLRYRSNQAMQTTEANV